MSLKNNFKKAILCTAEV